MNKLSIKFLIPAVLSTWLITISGCSKLEDKGIGYLEGKISIGPLCPVETVPPNPTCLPTAETYKAYPISICSSDGKRKIVQITPAIDGSYIVELNAGDYLIILDRVTTSCCSF